MSESIARILTEIVRQNIPRILYRAEFVGGQTLTRNPHIYPAFEILNIGEESLAEHSIGTSQRYTTEFLVDIKLSFLDDPKQYPDKYEIRNETYKLVRGYLTDFDILDFLNLNLQNVHWKSASREGVVENGKVLIVYNIQIGYKFLQNWDNGLSLPEIFSNIGKIKSSINKL